MANSSPQIKVIPVIMNRQPRCQRDATGPSRIDTSLEESDDAINAEIGRAVVGPLPEMVISARVVWVSDS